MTPWKYSDDYYREYTRTTWNESAKKYTKLLRNLEPYGFDLLARVDPKIRERCLDIATGPGEPAMSIARMVGLDGRVTGIDLSEEMIRAANEGAQRRRIPNVEFRVMDAETMAFPDETFDLAVSRFGFQIFTNPDTVAREAHRVLAPKGRIGVTVWSTAEKASAIHAVVGPMLEFAEPDETGYLPTPYELGGPGEMMKLFEDAGFHEAKEERKTHAMTYKNENEYVDVFVEGTPLGHSIREEDPLVQKKILARTRENLRQWRTRKGIEIPCECVIVTARK
ncbi:MAG: class I SAM-dependent methyltransferase [Methanobacteriota archaeon]|nr:MAG: class I SAM-dependent methyltransferase [Euryarchaeota archaeon]TLZ68699.1 MAG: class I SAM-dependent methyltransferase [Euryarchaeota archaeon]